MKLLEIEVGNYKSIEAQVSIRFQSALPTVLIGKNGSGKTNVLEALERIASSNSGYPGRYSSNDIRYRLYVRLEKHEFEKLFPNEAYSETKATFSAYSSKKDGLHIDTIKSDYLVPLLKKELVDIRIITESLESALADYKKELEKLACCDRNAVPLRCYDIINAKGNTTNYDILEFKVNCIIDELKRGVDLYCDAIESDDTFVFSNGYYSESFYHLNIERVDFKLEYKEPELAPFEKEYITLDTASIKREIAKINKKTKDIREKINALISELEAQSKRLMNVDSCGAITELVRNVMHIFGRNCGCVFNENSQVLFRDMRRENDVRYYDPERIISEAYVKATGKSELLENNEYQFKGKELNAFEEWLNDNRPIFDVEMYKRIAVSMGEKGEPIIEIEENNGKFVPLNETSAGRRWYFTYYFVKATLSKGDFFIIDEPASMLHPIAQKEVLQDILALSKEGIQVVYSTHSPYLIPEEWNCVGFVSMQKSTGILYFESKIERCSYLKSVVEDIFDLDYVASEYQQNPEKIAENCYLAIKAKDKTLENAAREMEMTVETIKSWHRKGKHFRSPKLENVIRVASYAGVSLVDLLGGVEHHTPKD